jgi:hypothetical protein
MMERRWLLRLVPPVVGALSIGLVAASSIGAVDGGWEPPACAGGTDRLSVAARAETPANPAALADEPWFTLDPELDEDGGLAGQRLRVGLGAERARFVALPAESAAAGPFGHLVLVAADDGRRSEILAIDAAAGCAWSLATDPDVVRRVTLDPTGESLYEFRVDRLSRADLGVWRRPLDGSPTVRVLDLPEPDPAFGITFSTTLAWSAEGDRLAVQSCGPVRCRTRLLDQATGVVTAVPGDDQGELVGIAGGHAIGYVACIGLPCPLVAVDLSNGATTVIEDEAGLAAIVATAAGPRVAVETAGAGGTVRIHRPGGGLDGSLELDGEGLRLMPGQDRAVAGTRVPIGWLVSAPDGRSPESAVLTRLSDGADVLVREVTR